MTDNIPHRTPGPRGQEPSRWLGPLLLTGVVIADIGFSVRALVRALPPTSSGLAYDFRVFYGAAAALAQHHDPYHSPALVLAEQAADHLSRPQPGAAQFVSAPIVAVVLRPLTGLPFWAAFALFSAVGLVVLAVSLAVLARDLGWRHWAILVLAVITTWIGFSGLVVGQLDALLFGVVAGGLVLAWRGHPAWAGALLALIWLKPDIAWPVPVFTALALWPDRRAAVRLGSAFTVSAALLLGIQWLVRPGLLGSWVREVLHFSRSAGHAQPDLAGLPGVVAALPARWGLGTGLTSPSSLGVLAIGCLAMAAVGWWLVRHPGGFGLTRIERLGWGVAIPLAIWLLVTPYSHPNDDLLLTPLVLLTLGRDARRVHGPGLLPAVAAVAALAFLWKLHVPLLPLLPLVAVIAAILLWVRPTDPRLTGFGVGIVILALVSLPILPPFHPSAAGLTSLAALALLIEAGRTLGMDVGAAASAPPRGREPPGGSGAGPATAAMPARPSP